MTIILEETQSFFTLIQIELHKTMSQVAVQTPAAATTVNTATENGEEAMEVEENASETQPDVEVNTQTTQTTIIADHAQTERNETTQSQPEVSIMTPQPAEPTIRSRLVETIVESPDEFRDETKAKASKRAKPKSPEKSPLKSPSRDEDVREISDTIMLVYCYHIFD